MLFSHARILQNMLDLACNMLKLAPLIKKSFMHILNSFQFSFPAGPSGIDIDPMALRCQFPCCDWTSALTPPLSF